MHRNECTLNECLANAYKLHLIPAFALQAAFNRAGERTNKPALLVSHSIQLHCIALQCIATIT